MILIGRLIEKSHHIVGKDVFKQQMESVTVVGMTKVAEFVQEHIVLKGLRQTHDIQVQIDISLC